MNEAEQTLIDYMNAMNELLARYHPPSEYVYKNVYDLILQNGTFFVVTQTATLPENINAGKAKECYRNAWYNVSEEYTYTEGYALVEGLPIAFEHAWLTTTEGIVIDPTWLDGKGIAYYGVKLNKQWVNSMILESETWGIIHNENNILTLLTYGFPTSATL